MGTIVDTSKELAASNVIDIQYIQITLAQYGED